MGVPFSTKLNAPGSVSPTLGQHQFAVSADGRYLISCGFWDNSFKVTNARSGKTIQSVRGHSDVVTSIAVSESGRFLVTGSMDACVSVWRLKVHNPGNTANSSNGADVPEEDVIGPVVLGLVHKLVGHDDTVTCVAVSEELDLVASSSADGTCILHMLQKGNYLRSICPGSQQAFDGIQWTPVESRATHIVPVQWVGLSNSGVINTYRSNDFSMHSYSINGRHLAHRETIDRLFAFVYTIDGEMIVAGGEGEKYVYTRRERSSAL